MKRLIMVLAATFAATVAFAQPPMGQGGPGGFGQGGPGGEGFRNFDPEEFEKMREEMMAEMKAGAYVPSAAEKNAKEIVVSTSYSSAQEASDALINLLTDEGYTLLTTTKARVYGYRNPSSRGISANGGGGFPGGGFPGGGFPGGGGFGGGFPGGGFPGGMPGMSSSSTNRPNEIDAKIKAKGGKVVITFLMPKPVKNEEDAMPNETGRIVKLIPDSTIEIIPR